MANELNAKLIEQLLAVDSPTICNAIERLNVRPRREGYMGPQIQCRFPDLGRVIGYAVTCTIVEHDEHHPPDPRERVKWLEAILQSPKPVICVVRDCCHRKGWASHWGEIMGTQVQVMGACGIITDGAVRDLEALHEIGMKVWSEYVVVSHGHIDVGLAQVPVEVGGLVIQPGDVLHADCNGVVSIPGKVLDQLPKAVDEILASEREMLARFRAPGYQFEVQERKTEH